MPRISVIIPCYNAEKYIERCLQALEEQTCQDFEVIIVNDCSKDATIDIAERYRLRTSLTIRVLCNEENVGPAKSRKRGIAVSTAEYIAFCDSDDWYDADFIEKMISKANELNADIVFCGYKTVLADGKNQKSLPHPLNNLETKIDKKQALRLNVDSLCTMMIKKSILDQIEGPDIRNGEDMAMIPILIVNANAFGIVEDSLYNYLCRAGSASLSANERVVNSLIQSFWYIDQNIPMEYRDECEFFGARNLLYGSLLNLFKYSYDVKKANSIIDTFENKYPNWIKNKNIYSLAKFKQIFLKLTKRRLFCGLKAFSFLHMMLTKS